VPNFIQLKKRKKK